MMILVAGPYRTGTGDDPALMQQNLRRLEEVPHAVPAAAASPIRNA